MHVWAPGSIQAPEGARFLEPIAALGIAIWAPGDCFWSWFLTGLFYSSTLREHVRRL
jgi:hypothetical protein